jgi:hypothetical protein
MDSLVPADVMAMAKGPHCRTAFEYSYIMKDLVKQAKQPGFTAADWAPLAELVDTKNFARTGNFREQVVWEQYDDLLTAWGRDTDWDFTILGATEGDGYAIIEMEERAQYPDRYEVYCSVSVHQYNAENKLENLRIYLSKAEPLASAHSHAWKLDEVEADILASGS